MKLHEFRKLSTQKITPVSTTAQLDAELIMMHVLNKSRAQLYIALEEILSKEDEKKLLPYITRRARGEPMAYLLGKKGFWTMDLTVTPDTLIPRPETECLVEWILTHYKEVDALRIADLGTGSGAIALALATVKPNWKIDATDQSEEALAIAKQNAEKHGIKSISFYSGDWFDALPQKNYDVIVSNPPYIPEKDPHLKHLKFEPKQALISGRDGLDAIRNLTAKARDFLSYRGYLVVEHGYDQAYEVADIFKSAGFLDIQSHRDLSDVSRFVVGRA